MKLAEVMVALEEMGNEQTRKTYKNHGANGTMFGVKIGDMKKIIKKIKGKKDHDLALELYETGNADAMYLACLIADEKKVTPDVLNHWVENAWWYMVGEYGVAGLAAESPHGMRVAMDWIESDKDHISAAGWATLGNLVSIRADEDLDLETVENLMHRVQKNIGQASNRTRYTMNGFLLGVGAYVTSLTPKTLQLGHEIGKVSVDMGGTACKVPFIPDYLQKMIDNGRIGKKRKYARC